MAFSLFLDKCWALHDNYATSDSQGSTRPFHIVLLDRMLTWDLKLAVPSARLYTVDMLNDLDKQFGTNIFSVIISE